MTVVRKFEGRTIKRTHRSGETIEIWLAAVDGRHPERRVIPFGEYLRVVIPHTEHRPAYSGGECSTHFNDDR